MSEKPTQHLPTLAQIGGEIEMPRAKIRQTCSEMQDEFEIPIAKADAVLAKR
jgi:hypothetical protein